MKHPRLVPTPLASPDDQLDRALNTVVRGDITTLDGLDEDTIRAIHQGQRLSRSSQNEPRRRR